MDSVQLPALRDVKVEVVLPREPLSTNWAGERLLARVAPDVPDDDRRVGREETAEVAKEAPKLGAAVVAAPNVAAAVPRLNRLWDKVKTIKRYSLFCFFHLA